MEGNCQFERPKFTSTLLAVTCQQPHCHYQEQKCAAQLLPFGLWAQMGPRNRVRWGPAVLRDVAMATNFGT